MIGEMNKNKNSGYWQYYYSNGTLESEGILAMIYAEGNWKWYYPDGTLKEEGAY